MKRWSMIIAIVAFLCGAQTGRCDAPITLNGAGATFPYPLYSKWFYDYSHNHTDVQFNYQSIGSGGGIRQITAKTVDFGASDAPMTSDELAKADGELIHIPTVLGAVALAYNLPGSPSLRISGTVLADIFLGTITRWNDPRIATLNPSVTLPNLPIFVVERSDGSGTTFVFTDYLTKVNPTWQTRVGTGKSVKFPVGIGAKGNEGVCGLVKQTPGAIGYVELGYALQNKIAVAALQNQSGEFVLPTIDSVSASAAGAIATMPADYRVSLTNASGTRSYPISSFTYLLVYKQTADAQKGKAVANFLKWALTDGQKVAPSLHYAPLPASMASRVLGTVETLK